MAKNFGKCKLVYPYPTKSNEQMQNKHLSIYPTNTNNHLLYVFDCYLIAGDVICGLKAKRSTKIHFCTKNY